MDDTSFEILHASSEESTARLGRLKRKRKNTETPNFLAISSRGVVPHLTQDMLRDHTNIEGIYAGLEDSNQQPTRQEVVERLPNPPPVYSHPSETPLRGFIALPVQQLLVLGPRRIPALPNPNSNLYTSIGISTSVGFQTLEVHEYITAARKLRPDIVVGIADVESKRDASSGGTPPGLKRREKMVERTREWMRALHSELQTAEKESGWRDTELWAPILPIEKEMQLDYLDWLEETQTESLEKGKTALKGIVLCDDASIDYIPDCMKDLPRLSVVPYKNPSDALRAMSLGADLITLSFVTEASDRGIALDFEFLERNSKSDEMTRNAKKPLGVDMWSKEWIINLGPLKRDCSCHACNHHHRAYIQHLLSANEMLAWVILQVHNHHIATSFFRDVRESIRNGTFELDVELFSRRYEANMPATIGQGPRLRGYQTKNDGPDPKKMNPKPYSRLEKPKSIINDSKPKLKETEDTPLFDDMIMSFDLERLGFGEKHDLEEQTK